MKVGGGEGRIRHERGLRGGRRGRGIVPSDTRCRGDISRRSARRVIKIDQGGRYGILRRDEDIFKHH